MWYNENERGFIGNINPIRYRGYYFDRETGLYYLQSRYYDPETGRFLSPDSIDYLEPHNFTGMNLYAYCGNNPVMCCDPTGHSPDGILSQVFTSVFSYAGMAIASVFNEDIRSDMDAIGWNPFNNNEQTVLNSTAVSFYKGVPVFRTGMDRSGSFCAIFLNDQASIDTVRHEYGHNVQQMILGPLTYGLTIGLPSALKWSSRPYYERPWEITADYFGDVESRSHSSQNMSRGYQYLEVARLFGIFAYLFLPGEYNT